MYKLLNLKTSKNNYYADFYIPRQRFELIHYLKVRGYRKLYRMTLGQLRGFYTKIRLEEEGRIL